MGIDSRLLDSLKVLTVEEQRILEGTHEVDLHLYTDNDQWVIDKLKLLDSGKLIDVRPHTRFVDFPEHRHNYVEVVYVCEGETHHIINGQEVVLKEGELLFLHQKATQAIKKAGMNDVAVNFIILPEFFDQSMKMMGSEDNMMRDFIIGCLQDDRDDIPYLHFKVADVLPVQNLVENLIWTIKNRQHNKRSINQITMGLLILQLINHMDKVQMGHNNFDQSVLFSVYHYINEHYKDGEMTILARQLNMELYELSRMIKQLTGKTYKELLQSKRLEQAAFLLKNTKMTFYDIAYAVGYNNVSYFYRIFKAKFNKLPKEYRNS